MIPRLRAADLLKALSELPRDRDYPYVAEDTTTRLFIDSVTAPEGPIWIRRYDPAKGDARSSATRASISGPMLWRVANGIAPGKPFNIDRILGASYNTRSALESLLAHSPQFHVCYPGRIEMRETTQQVKDGHKHLIWLPDNPHPLGVISRIETQIVIAEHAIETVYESIALPETFAAGGLDIGVARRHAQIQIALILIGRAMGYRSYIAKNDQGILYDDRPLATLEGVVTDLSTERLLSAFGEGALAGAFIDCVWFRNSTFMPAVLEVEESTGVTSGLTRMKSFKDKIPAFPTRYVIVAADENRDEVYRKASEPQFADLAPRFFPYSAVEELHWFAARRGVQSCGDGFIDSFMEPILV
jgi:type II restriction enzyme